MEKTDLKKLKEMTLIMADIVKPEEIGMSGLINHPFLNTKLWYNKVERNEKGKIEKQNWLDITKEENYNIWKNEFKKQLNKCDLPLIYIQWRDAWKLTFMKYCGEFLSDKDYAKYLADAWVTEENPNMDVNVTRKEALKMFKKCKKEYLMEKDDYEYWKSIPNEVILYRGVSKGRVKLGLSWTDNKEIAKWFMNRWDNSKNCLLKVKVNKKDIIAYFNTRNEEECLLDVLKYKDKINVVHKI